MHHRADRMPRRSRGGEQVMPARDHMAKMRRMRRDGRADAAIGRRFGITRERVGQLLGPRGDKMPDHTDEFIAQARSLWDEGHSTSEIGRRMNVTKNVIVGVAHRNDFPPRPSPLKVLSTTERRERAKLIKLWNTQQYTSGELATRFGLGHSTTETVIQTAQKSGKAVYCSPERRAENSSRAGHAGVAALKQRLGPDGYRAYRLAQVADMKAGKQPR